LRRRKILVGARHAEYTLLSLTKAGVIVRDISTGKGKFSADMGTSQEVREGELVFCLFDIPETPRTVGLSPYDGMITGAYTVFSCENTQLAAYLDLFYRAMDDRKLLAPLYSGLRNTIPPTRFLGTKTPIPPSEEQVAIVRFLGHASRRITKAIRTKQRLIKLLEEQKLVVLHQAVTRGLDPGGPMRDSGVEWLGNVPEHWDVVPLKRIAWFKSGAGFPVDEQGGQDSEIPFLKVSDMNRAGNNVWIETASSTVSRSTAARLGAFIFPVRTIIFPKVGGALLTNKRRLLRKPSCIDNNVMGCVVEGADIEYAFTLLQQLDLGRLAKPGPVPAISESDVREIKVALPPIQEQTEIVTSARRATADLDRAVSTAKREISLLLEYRTCLISNVVTGKLDVRQPASRLPDEVDEPGAPDESESLADEEQVAVLDLADDIPEEFVT
jgi:type I restriction enzyme S subunit